MKLCTFKQKSYTRIYFVYRFLMQIYAIFKMLIVFNFFPLQVFLILHIIYNIKCIYKSVKTQKVYVYDINELYI